MDCNYRWTPPWIAPPSMSNAQRNYIQERRAQGLEGRERCILGPNHSGDHRSIHKVTCKNLKDRDRG